ncbi:ATPase [uncultured Clostridium sp.]|uniref:ATPase n=1 Tax=uncultured Clostridium sp. TaxID=59620 RepID=UPI0028E25CA1|nr:ATPase [uncultured Clostridium sp.]
MAIEALNSIKDAETKGEEIIKAAQQESKDIIKNAEIKSIAEYKRIIDEANSLANNMVSEALKKGEEEGERIKEGAEKDISDIINIPDDKMEKAINLIVERIVK